MINLLDNLDLLAIGVATAGSGILGFAVYYNNRKNTTNRFFLIFSLITIFWGITNYLASYADTAQSSLWLARLVMFFAVWQAFSFFLLLYVFPNGTIDFKNRNFVSLLVLTIFVSLVTLSPYLFPSIIHYSRGYSPEVAKGPGLISFALFSISLVLLGLFSFINRIIKSKKEERRPFIIISLGMIMTFFLIVTLNFILPSLLNNYSYISFGSLFTLPFIFCTGYAIARHKIFNIKVFSTEIFIFVLLAISFLEFISTKTLLEFILRFFIFFSLSLFSILLIKGVITEVKQKEKYSELADSFEKANIQLKELDRQKTDFLSIAAHQLRTPLSILNGYIELLRDGAYGAVTKEQVEVFNNIDESNGHLVKLVDSFLDITRLEQGRTKYDFAEHDLNEMIDGVVKELEMKADIKENLKINWSQNPGLPKTIYDEEKIRHVVYNFIDNAIKYSDKGEINVDVARDGDGVAVRVRDSGIGFDKVDEVNFFQKFYRGNNVLGMNVTGTGLGLYVCAKFIEAHHGRVWCKSVGIGKGSEFGFWIPTHQA
jgi:signal transduction histidine kinase